MPNSRSSKRTGFGINKGGLTPRIVRSDSEPINPTDKDFWVDTSYVPPILKTYKAATDAWVGIVNYGITDLDFYDDGFFVTYDDGSEEEWDWTLDGSDRITNLTNTTTNRTIAISWTAGNKP